MSRMKLSTFATTNKFYINRTAVAFLSCCIFRSAVASRYKNRYNTYRCTTVVPPSEAIARVLAGNCSPSPLPDRSSEVSEHCPPLKRCTRTVSPRQTGTFSVVNVCYPSVGTLPPCSRRLLHWGTIHHCNNHIHLPSSCLFFPFHLSFPVPPFLTAREDCAGCAPARVKGIVAV